MAAQQNFRSAFNGFNRDDVVRYIEYLNAKHTAEINQLNSELAFLRGKESDQPAIAPADPETDAIIEQQANRIRELFDRCNALEEELSAVKSARDDLAQQHSNDLDAALTEKTQIAAQLEAAQQQQTAYKSRMEEELEAYRRAERTERLARERAEQLYRQANGALADATVKVDSAASQIGQLTDRVMTQLAELQDAVTGSKQALRDAAATMYTIRPYTEEQ